MILTMICYFLFVFSVLFGSIIIPCLQKIKFFKNSSSILTHQFFIIRRAMAHLKLALHGGSIYYDQALLSPYNIRIALNSNVCFLFLFVVLSISVVSTTKNSQQKQ